MPRRKRGASPASSRISAASVAALNPNIEIVSTDDDKGIITVKDKKNGKTFTVNFEDAKNGKFSMKEDGKDSVTVSTQGDGKDGALEIKTGDGTTRIGGGNAKVPTWIPDYPGAQAQGAFSSQTAAESSGMYHFTTKDPIDKVAKFYEDGFKTSNLKVTSTISNSGGKIAGGVVNAEDDSRTHTATVGLSTEGSDTTVSVTFTMKK